MSNITSSTDAPSPRNRSPLLLAWLAQLYYVHPSQPSLHVIDASEAIDAAASRMDGYGKGEFRLADLLAAMLANGTC